MIYRIVQYIQPWEIDDFDRQIDKLILSSYYLDRGDKVILDCSLNISDNICNWENSMEKDYFKGKYDYIAQKASYYFDIEFDTNESIQGCTDKRRESSLKMHDFIIWLDSDVFFSVFTLPYLIQGSKSIDNNLFILSPEIIKYWDASWDCITAKKFLNQPFNQRDTFDLYSLDFDQSDRCSIMENNTIKFGGGWFNLFSKNVFDKIDIPTELGSYAQDDLYIMTLAPYKDIKQFILNGVIVSEIGNKYLIKKDYIKKNMNIKIGDKQKISNEEFLKIISKKINE